MLTPADIEDGLRYFEEGCLCVLTGKIPPPDLTGEAGYEYYLDNCTCSRHPESATRRCWDRDYPEQRKAALALLGLVRRGKR